MTDAELKELVASLAIAQRETDRQLKETDRQLKETGHQLKETDRRLSKQLSELGKQIGGLGEKFGSFTEGLALPSMEKILRERFQMEAISPRLRITRDGRHMEIDVFAFANGAINRGYIVEVKSHVREEAIPQLQRILAEFKSFFPEHKDKALFGILAGVDIGQEMRERILRAGFYVAEIHDAVFSLDTPEGFEPTAY
jgi:hypothetical protein